MLNKIIRACHRAFLATTTFGRFYKCQYRRQKGKLVASLTPITRAEAISTSQEKLSRHRAYNRAYHCTHRLILNSRRLERYYVKKGATLHTVETPKIRRRRRRPETTTVVSHCGSV